MAKKTIICGSLGADGKVCWRRVRARVPVLGVGYKRSITGARRNLNLVMGVSLRLLRKPVRLLVSRIERKVSRHLETA
jgi:hypothetical protein